MKEHKIYGLIENSPLLPKLPDNISQILILLKNPMETDIDLLIEKVSQLNDLNNLMLKNINSGYFRLSREIKSIKEAVVYLGMKTVQNLLIIHIIQQLFSGGEEKRNRMFDMKMYWKHVLGTAVASCLVSEKLKKGDKYKLFSYGLLHDIGITILDICLPDYMDKVIEKIFKGLHQVAAERIVLGGITHADVGAWICRKWNIREDIINIIEFHHTPLYAQSNNEYIKMLYVGDVISNNYYQRLLGLNPNYEMDKQIAISLGLTDEDIREMVEEFPAALEQAWNYNWIL